MILMCVMYVSRTAAGAEGHRQRRGKTGGRGRRAFGSDAFQAKERGAMEWEAEREKAKAGGITYSSRLRPAC